MITIRSVTQTITKALSFCSSRYQHGVIADISFCILCIQSSWVQEAKRSCLLCFVAFLFNFLFFRLKVTSQTLCIAWDHSLHRPAVCSTLGGSRACPGQEHDLELALSDCCLLWLSFLQRSLFKELQSGKTWLEPKNWLQPLPPTWQRR